MEVYVKERTHFWWLGEGYKYPLMLYLWKENADCTSLNHGKRVHVLLLLAKEQC